MNIQDIFTDEVITSRIQKRLPEMFQIAELESSRDGKVGMEVGSVRERILIALLIHKFGKENVDTEIPITMPEVDVIVFKNPISIKTTSGSNLGSVKLIWTVDAEKAREFGKLYTPTCDMLLSQINWGNVGYLFFFPKSIQIEVLERIGREIYIKLPKVGTNPRGVEISTDALRILANHPKSLKIAVEWKKKEIVYRPYERWLDLWKKD
jgi:hypothetical protein